MDVHVGSFLRRRRVAIPLSLNELAALVGIDADELMRVEAGRQRASAEQLLKLCRFFGIKPAELYRNAPIVAVGKPSDVAAQ